MAPNPIRPIAEKLFFVILAVLENQPEDSNRLQEWLDGEKTPRYFDLPDLDATDLPTFVQWGEAHPESCAFWYERLLFYVDYA
ncbi:MAG: hypothetical protein LUQ37_10010 [Methanoregulaceae archaeon]|jgi:hypothetical protein|nr:hypothetical protein [Methanoregulaceae archaeon]